ncbi:HSP20-like chaperone [Mucor mucedo]|uniref:HSP20-like chaperone n=1 Tax=Mucor mucedo TaxID=29922 RepID=UPI00222055F0|nr:HSP20-like chaperone [Mucor mucedo]KAI7882097.1 HSP20-like chaperone [Mucor mucedo]
MSLTQRLFSDAFHDMQRAMSALEQPLINTGRLLGSQNSNLLRYPATDIHETEDSYELQAELPGYDKKDIKIEVGEDGRTLVVSGNVEKDKAASSGDKKQSQELTTKKDSDSQVATRGEAPQWWVNERVVGSFTRSFSFPTTVNADTIKASYDNGILKVVVPKVKENAPKSIQID